MKGIIFDLDGTLANTAFIHKEAWEIALRKLNLKSEVKIETLLGRRTAEIAKILAGNRWEELMRIKNEEYLHLVERKARSRECANELVNMLKRKGYLIAVVTSSNKISANKVLTTIGIIPDILVTGDDVNKGKPDPQSVLLALKLMKLPSSEVIGVGDTEVDVIAYKEAGLKEIYLVKSEVPVDENKVKSLGAKIFNSLCEIMKRLNS